MACLGTPPEHPFRGGVCISPAHFLGDSRKNRESWLVWMNSEYGTKLGRKMAGFNEEVGFESPLKALQRGGESNRER